MRPRSPPISKAETTITSPRHTDHAFDSLPVSLRVLKRKTGHPEAGRSDRVSENHSPWTVRNHTLIEFRIQPYGEKSML